VNALAIRFLVPSLAIVPAAAIAQTYSVTDLQPGSGFDDAIPYGISQNGKITGAGTVTATGELHAFIYDNGVIQDLGMFGYPYGAGGVAINNAGQIAATAYGPGYHAIIYSNGQTHALGSIDGGFSEGLSINNLGHIVGRGINGDGGGQGFTYFGPGTFTALNVDIARGVNDLDQFVGSVGYYWSYGGFVHSVEHGFVMQSGTLTDLGDLGGGLRTNTEAYAINSAGQITGYSTLADGTIHAFRYTAGTMEDLGTIPSYYTYGVSINSGGDVVGSVETYVGGSVSAFLYTGGTLHNFADLLDSSGAAWSGFTVTQINDAGWIVGSGTVNGAATHGFLARPVAPPCYANCDGSTTVPVLNVADFTCFLQRYAAADPYANCDNSTTPPVLNVADFTCFLQKFAAGCP
jgi:probable HAF family extracellular repeat protein